LKQAVEEDAVPVGCQSRSILGPDLGEVIGVLVRGTSWSGNTGGSESQDNSRLQQGKRGKNKMLGRSREERRAGAEDKTGMFL